MTDRDAHLADEQLVLFSDQELPLRRAARARGHLARCEPCRSRLARLEAASEGFADLRENEIRAQIPLSLEARNRLRGRLRAQLAEDGSRVGQPQANFRGPLLRRMATACLALLLVAGATWTARLAAPRFASENLSGTRSEAATTEPLALPRRALTPGSARAVPITDLCRDRDLANDPPVDPSLRRAVFDEYGLPASSSKDYELDYLIAPALGGAESLQNLWPQPSSSTWNAVAKDQLEDHLHELVCQGKVPLATAQRDLASDWIASYKRYFHTESPLANAATLGAPFHPGARILGGRHPARATSG